MPVHDQMIVNSDQYNKITLLVFTNTIFWNHAWVGLGMAPEYAPVQKQ